MASWLGSLGSPWFPSVSAVGACVRVCRRGGGVSRSVIRTHTFNTHTHFQHMCAHTHTGYPCRSGRAQPSTNIIEWTLILPLLPSFFPLPSPLSPFPSSLPLLSLYASLFHSLFLSIPTKSTLVSWVLQREGKIKVTDMEWRDHGVGVGVGIEERGKGREAKRGCLWEWQ